MYVDSYVIDENSSEKIVHEYLECVQDLLDTKEVQTLEGFEQHFDINRLDHVRSVSFLSYRVCRKLGWDAYGAARGGILHDLFYYDWRENNPDHNLHGYRHPGFALKNAEELCGDRLTDLEREIIIRHMWPLTPIPPRRREAYVVTMMDKYCAMQEIYISMRPKRAERHRKAIKIALKRHRQLRKKENV